jgi:hypothetical protein
MDTIDKFKAKLAHNHAETQPQGKRKENEQNGQADDNGAIDLIKAFTFLGDAPHAPPRKLIDGLIPAEGVAVTGGQSTAGKTFIEIHKSICLATPTQYFGRKIIERVGTVFVAAEGLPLLPNRFAAAVIKLSVEAKLPITWPKLLPDFSSAAGIKLFFDSLKHWMNAIRANSGCVSAMW